MTNVSKIDMIIQKVPYPIVNILVPESLKAF